MVLAAPPPVWSLGRMQEEEFRLLLILFLLQEPPGEQLSHHARDIKIRLLGGLGWGLYALNYTARSVLSGHEKVSDHAYKLCTCRRQCGFSAFAELLTCFIVTNFVWSGEAVLTKQESWVTLTVFLCRRALFQHQQNFGKELVQNEVSVHFSKHWSFDLGNTVLTLCALAAWMKSDVGAWIVINISVPSRPLYKIQYEYFSWQKLVRIWVYERLLSINIVSQLYKC